MKILPLIRWIFYRRKINLKDLNESTDKFEVLLKKYGEQEKEVQELYDYFKPLFQQIRNGEITKPKKDGYLSNITYEFREIPPIAQFSDLKDAYDDFLTDITGDRYNPLDDL